MAIGDEILIAKESSVQSVLTDTFTLKTEATNIKTLLANGAVYGDNFNTFTVDNANTVVNLTGKYELLGLMNLNTSNTVGVRIQIDGQTNRKEIQIAANANLSLVGYGIKSTTSMYVTSNLTVIKAIYRLLP